MTMYYHGARMTFSVDPVALNGYAALLARARARDDAQQCKAYFDGNVPDLSPGVDGLINPICYEHTAVQQKLGAMLDQLVALLAPRGTRWQPRRLATRGPTRTQPQPSTGPIPRLPARNHGGTDMAFNDVTDPVGQLKPPAERTESILGQPFSNPASVLDWVSPSHIVNEFVKQAVGYDIFGEASKLFAGDWELVWQAAGAYCNLANAMQDIGVNVSHGNVELDYSWESNAGDAAFMYFADLSCAISSQQISLNALADSYEKAAEGSYRIGETVSGIMKDIMDAATIGAVAASAGTATIETGVGFVTGWGVADSKIGA